MLGLLGKGGMGEVYAAERMGSSERVAVKVFTCDSSRKEFLRKRFLAEGRLLHHLNHPRLVKVSEIGIDPKSDTPYYVMDLVSAADGKSCTLEDWRQRGEYDETDVVRIYSELREALLYLESQGVVHRDVKLENVLIDAEGHVRLADFGVSRIFDEDLRRQMVVTTTFVGERAPIMGSAGYLAPELKNGAPATPASDAWALGVLVFRLLSGVWYEADSAAEELIAGFDDGWSEVLRRLLADDPAKRLPIPEFRPARRKFGWKSILGGVVAAALLGIGLWIGLGTRTKEQLKDIELDLGPYGKLDFVACPPGEVELMTDWQTGGLYRVTLTKPYWIMRYPLTNRQMSFYPPLYDREVMDGKADDHYAYPNKQLAKGIIEIFNQRLKSRLPEGYEIRLPTLAEWERAYHADASDPSDPYYDLTHIHIQDDLWKRIAYDHDAKGPMRQTEPNRWGIGDWCGFEKVYDTFAPEELEKSPDYAANPSAYQIRALPRPPSLVDPVWQSDATNRAVIVRMPFWARWCGSVESSRDDWTAMRLVIGPKLK